MNTCLKLIEEKYKITALEELAQKKDSKVYKGRIGSQKIILKMQKNLINYNREKISLEILKEKDVNVPQLLYYGIIEDNEPTGYLIENFLDGETMLDVYKYKDIRQKEKMVFQVGKHLGLLNISFDRNELEKSELWKYAYDNCTSYSQYSFIHFYELEMHKWIERVNTVKIDRSSFDIIFHAISQVKEVENSFIHRDYGFRNIMVENDEIKGVIDFEYAIPGDMYFDLSKIIFNDLDFFCDNHLRNIFFEGWSYSTGKKIDWTRLWLYLAIQGMGAIQWVNRQDNPIIIKANQTYKRKGLDILQYACKKLK